jgi:hypothetical protein
MAGGDCLAGLGISEAVPDGRRIPENWYWYVYQIGACVAQKLRRSVMRQTVFGRDIYCDRVRQPALSPRGHWFPCCDGSYGVDDVAGGDPESFEELGGFSASRNFSHR